MADGIAAIILVIGIPVAWVMTMQAIWAPPKPHIHRRIVVGKHEGKCRCGMPVVGHRG